MVLKGNWNWKAGVRLLRTWRPIIQVTQAKKGEKVADDVSMSLIVTVKRSFLMQKRFGHYIKLQIFNYLLLYWIGNIG